MVLADEARMQQVLWNLLRNAIKFSKEGGRIEVRTQLEGTSFVLDCRDDGIGIDPEALPRIFSAFEQADRQVSQGFGGLGLGLAIARGLVTEHKGELTAHSEGRGQGATFRLKLRSYVPEEIPVDGPLPPLETEQGSGWRLLLVEDNADAAETIVMCLESYGYRVTHVATCAEAVRTARQQPFDIVLTDLGLPDGSGIDVGRALSKSLPVVALSGYGATPDLQRSKMAGFAGHLVKPAEPQAIHSALQKALNARATSTAS
ncbi:MAG TPA: hybrid sensor histidine kinase/response regulator, partial [Ramlibacter sp.]